MFKYQFHALAMRKLGLGRTLARIALIVLLGCVIAGAIYLVVILNAVEQRSNLRHDQQQSIR